MGKDEHSSVHTGSMFTCLNEGSNMMKSSKSPALASPKVTQNKSRVTPRER